MLADRVSIATITWARDNEEEALLGSALAALAHTGLPIAVADRGNRPAFSERLARIQGLRLVDGAPQGLCGQVAASLEAADRYRRPFILYTEPDKESFFTGGLADFLRRAPDTADVGVVIPSRSQRALETFPEMQWYTEGVLNHLCGAITGCACDYSYGPFLFNRALLSELLPLDPTLGWGWRPFLFVSAHRRGYRIAHIEGDYSCPAAQRREDGEERRHRLRQLSENLRGLIARP